MAQRSSKEVGTMTKPIHQHGAKPGLVPGSARSINTRDPDGDLIEIPRRA
jgi:hypothetical protein